MRLRWPAPCAQITDVDVVHTQMPFVYPTQVAGRLALKIGKPLFYHQRGVFHPSRLQFRGWKKRLYIDLVEKPIMRRATGLVALTTEEVDSYRALGVDTPCHVFQTESTLAAFAALPGQARFPTLRSRNPSRSFYFWAGSHPVKGADLLVRAFAQIANGHPNAVLVLAGPDEASIAGRLQSLASSQQLADRILLTGMVTGERKLDLLGRADLFVLPSMGEGLSMAVLEALASGTPAVLSPECNLSIVQEAGAGQVVERDVAQLAAVMSDLLSDRTRLRAMARFGVSPGPAQIWMATDPRSAGRAIPQRTSTFTPAAKKGPPGGPENSE